MQNEELTKELNALQEKFNKEIEDVKKKYEKPNKIKSGWYKYKDNSSNWWLGYINEDFTYYGFNEAGWFSCSGISLSDINIDNYTPAIHKEVEEALTKEAFKKYDGKKFKSLYNGETYNFDILDFDHFKRHGIIYNSHGESLFDNGKWAEIVKEKTLDELASEFYDYYSISSNYTVDEDFKQFFIYKAKENKQEVINILNNL